VAILYRPARADELQETQEHIVRSINDLCERHGFGPMATVRTPEFQLFSLGDDPGGLWTAEEDGQLVGSTFAWTCGDGMRIAFPMLLMSSRAFGDWSRYLPRNPGFM
jgi:hypothetical protein